LIIVVVFDEEDVFLIGFNRPWANNAGALVTHSVRDEVFSKAKLYLPYSLIIQGTASPFAHLLS